MTQNILVAGGAGYVGSHVCKALRDRGYFPITLDNLSTGHADAVKWGPLVQGEISDTATVGSVVRDFGIRAVMHFAASSLVPESVRNPRAYYFNNVVGTLAFLDALVAAEIREVVFSSSAAVYGDPGLALIDERTPLDPVNPYGETKRVIESALSWLGTAHGFSACSLRYFNAAGADPAGEAGERHDPETHLVPNLIRANLDGSDLPVFGTDYPTADGTAVRDYVHVSDLAEAHVAALEWLQRGGEGGAINLGGGQGISVLEMVTAADQALGRKTRVDLCPRRAGDPVRLVADIARASRLLNWTPDRSTPEFILLTAASFERRMRASSD